MFVCLLVLMGTRLTTPSLPSLSLPTTPSAQQARQKSSFESSRAMRETRPRSLYVSTICFVVVSGCSVLCVCECVLLGQHLHPLALHVLMLTFVCFVVICAWANDEPHTRINTHTRTTTVYRECQLHPHQKVRVFLKSPKIPLPPHPPTRPSHLSACESLFPSLYPTVPLQTFVSLVSGRLL